MFAATSFAAGIDKELQNEAQNLDDHLETYIGPAQSMARQAAWSGIHGVRERLSSCDLGFKHAGACEGHSSGPYELKPGQQAPDEASL